jgi:glyoxylase-like metal-dependent hydrolase (beta-lactamase superfamily II)/rhodanese-related sulfurtransferase
VELHLIATPSLGDSSYLLTHEGSGLVVDPQRDLKRYLEAIERAGVSVTHVLDTHVHNDYLSGAASLAGRLGAEPVMPAAARVGFAFRPAFHREDIAAGPLTIRPLHTPGHTPEHTSYLVLAGEDPVVVFSGGSLLVGSAGRCDLLGPQLARSLARLQHGSVHRLADLPDQVVLCPTHGAGSFCTSSAAGATTSRIEVERRANPVLRYPDPDSFADAQLSGLLPYPVYYRYMADLNLAGPEAWEGGVPATLTPEEVDRPGLAVVDGRSRQLFAAGHLPEAIGVELGSQFASWVGWLVPFGTPVVLVLDPGQDAELAAEELARIGYRMAGVMWGVEEWSASGRPLHRHRLASAAEMATRLDEIEVIDVRDPLEWELGHLQGSVHRYVPDLVDDPPDTQQPWLVCASGFRSNIAAGLLCRRGSDPVVVSPGGIPDLLHHRPDLRA